MPLLGTDLQVIFEDLTDEIEVRLQLAELAGSVHAVSRRLGKGKDFLDDAAIGAELPAQGAQGGPDAVRGIELGLTDSIPEIHVDLSP